jgi:xanthine dehydrogenase molybdopterin-binding subunit B
VHPDGTATVAAGTSAHGQGHATTFAMIVADRLRIPVERIRFVQSDTAQVPRGVGTEGSQSVQLGGSAVHQAAGEVLDRARRQAAALLEAADADIELTDAGIFQITGVPSTGVTWAHLADAAQADARALAAAVDRRQDGAVFPFGAHVAAVEVDIDTDLPCTPERVWRAVQDARAGRAAPLWHNHPRCSRRCRRASLRHDGGLERCHASSAPLCGQATSMTGGRGWTWGRGSGRRSAVSHPAVARRARGPGPLLRGR